MKIAISIAIAASSLLAADGQTIKTSDGETFTNAIITELRPNGAVVRSDSGVATIPYAKLPKELQTRYGYDAEELANHLKQGLDGAYALRDAIVVFAGEVIDLKQGRFAYSTFSDVGPFRDERPLQGRFTVTGNWLVLHHPKIQFPTRVISVLDGRIALLKPHEYKEWRETGERSLLRPLTREKAR